MAFTEARRASIIAKYIRAEYVTVTQKWFHTAMHKTTFSRNTVLPWHTRFLQDKNMEYIGGNGTP